MANNSTINGKLRDEAEFWIVKLRSDSLSYEEKRQFSEWLNTSEEHTRAFDEAFEIWETLAAVSYAAKMPAVETNHSRSEGLIGRVASRLNPANWLSQFSPIYSGVGFACIFALVAAIFTFTKPVAEKAPTRYTTGIGEIRTVELADGSYVELNTQSILEVLYKRDKRELTLLKGEGYFSVTPDKKRPFVVDFGKGSATAVGTQFNIFRTQASTSVTVTEGIVDVREVPDLAIPNPHATRITENQQVKVGRRGISPVRNLDASRQVAWRSKTIIFRDTPLAVALDELNRYLLEPVDTSSASLSGHRVSGTFSLSSPNETLDALTTAFNLTKTPSSSSNTLYLRNE